MRSFLTKVRRYSAPTTVRQQAEAVRVLGRPESVLASYHTKEEAQEHADRWNRDYQTDTAFVEPYDPDKLEWPDRHGWNGVLDD